MNCLIPKNEDARLLALSCYDILDTPPDPSFDRITNLASRLFRMPIALVSLVDAERQWFKSRHGLDVDETPRDIAFCARAILDEEVMVVPDAASDERFVGSPLVVNEPQIRFYAGAPLRTRDGFNLGTLCVIDRVPRLFDEEQKALLRDLAGIAVDQLELRRLAALDELTAALNRRYLMETGEKELRRARRYGYPVSLAMLDVDGFKAIGERHGDAAGDAVLKAIAAFCTATLRQHDTLGRYGGDKFAIVMPYVDETCARTIAERLRHGVSHLETTVDGARLPFTVSIGVAGCPPFDEAFGDVLARAEAALHEAKAAGRNRVALSQAA